jgi:hypothetical protein
MSRVLIAGICFLLAGCGKAVATDPDSRNPAHCYAALNFANYWLRKGGQHSDKVAEGEARMLFEMNKFRSSGRSGDDFFADGKAFTESYGNDRNRMNALLLDCLKAEEADPEFLREYANLLALARSHPSAP